MIIKQTLKRLVGGIIMTLGVSIVPLSIPAFAANNTCGVETSIISCASGTTANSPDLQKSGLWSILILAIQILTAGIGVAALGGIVYGIILYITSSGDPGNIKKALEVIRNVVIGIVAYAIMWALLNWLIPGGVFN